LRRELNDVLQSSTRQRETASGAGPPAVTHELDREEQGLLSEETTPLQPLRVPAFPEKFSPMVAGFPQHVARNAMNLIGRLAAGEPSAFVGMRRLRARHDICRVRVGADYRLLFRLDPDRLEVLDLINRKDFEKWLKKLV
jgi:hypothetical protein